MKRTEDRIHNMKNILKKRKNNVRVMLSDIQNEHNISAIIRTCDFFGIQYIDILSSKFTKDNYPINIAITKKVEKWMDITFWKSSRDYIKFLKKHSYQFYITMLGDDVIAYSKVNYHEKITIGFGNERQGFTDKNLIKNCNGKIIIPKLGFSQSLNVSVSVGVILSMIELKRSKKDDQFETEEKRRIYKKWKEL
jgi:tRNA (guanosine-2'-O-)-methyltransferase